MDIIKLTSPTISPFRNYKFLFAIFWVATVIISFNSFHLYFSARANNSSLDLTHILVEEITAAYSGTIFIPFFVIWARSQLLQKQSFRLKALFHVIGLLIFTSLQLGLMWIARISLFPVLDLGVYDYPLWPWRIAIQVPADVIMYVLTVTMTHVVDQFRMARAHELQSAQLEAALAESKLEALHLQLAPHFLFNVLNAAASTMYDNPRAADEMLARLGTLLRATLSATGTHEHSLADELRLLGLYLDIQHARFGSRLQVSMDVPTHLTDVFVPFLLLQPLVENATQYGVTQADLSIKIEVKARQENNMLQLFLRDHGPGFSSQSAAGLGIGLTNTKAKLAALYGKAASFEQMNAADGGLQIVITLPWRTPRVDNC